MGFWGATKLRDPSESMSVWGIKVSEFGVLRFPEFGHRLFFLVVEFRHMQVFPLSTSGRQGKVLYSRCTMPP